MGDLERLTKSTHFIHVRSNRTVNLLAKLFVKEIIKLHGVPTSIVSDRDPLFASGFWKSLQKALGTKLNFSTAYHPQSDGQTKCVNQTLEDLLRACVLDVGGSWEDQISLVEFSYNNSFQSSIGMTPFEALYGRLCRSPSCWLEAGEKLVLGLDFIRDSTEKIDLIRHRMKEAQSRQKSYADNRRRKLEFSVEDFVCSCFTYEGCCAFQSIVKISTSIYWSIFHHRTYWFHGLSPFITGSIFCYS